MWAYEAIFYPTLLTLFRFYYRSAHMQLTSSKQFKSALRHESDTRIGWVHTAITTKKSRLTHTPDKGQLPVTKANIHAVTDNKYIRTFESNKVRL